MELNTGYSLSLLIPFIPYVDLNNVKKSTNNVSPFLTINSFLLPI